jgi:hypothetical protein
MSLKASQKNQKSLAKQTAGPTKSHLAVLLQKTVKKSIQAYQKTQPTKNTQKST